ncbi:MAG TPA: phosphotransferase [Catenuloplanes sp.]
MAATTKRILPRWLTDPTGPLGPGAVIVRGEQLRVWGLSEVWRVHLGGPVPASVIVKRGAGEMAEEARRYRDLVVPLGVAAPKLLAAAGGDDGAPAVLVLQDVGPDTLEQRPTADGYREAVRALARMRSVAARRLADDPAIGGRLRRTTADFVDTARRVGVGLTRVRPDLTGATDDPARVLLERLSRPAGQPDTIVHGDFHAKNLVHGNAGGRIVAVDWPGAYVHPHLGDLYCLIREADQRGLTRDVATATLPGVFAEAAGVEPARVADQLVTGGLCWTLTALRWVVEEGLHAVPVSRDWIDGLVAEFRALAADRPGP